ncbi:hypothetical protein ACS0TY_026136 [Phlomoides rotata]
MAGVLETLSVPRVSAFPSASLPPVAGSNSVRFSEFQGLKIQPIRASIKLSSTQKLARRGSRIVCEAQETAIQEYFLNEVVLWLEVCVNRIISTAVAIACLWSGVFGGVGSIS